jgi:hypothetical protein
MLIRCICSAALVAFALMFASPEMARAADDGIVKFKSAYDMPETIKRMKKDIADKGIMFFDEIDQAKLAADAGVTLLPSTLLVFGNPPLGTLFRHGITNREKEFKMASEVIASITSTVQK